MAATAAAAGAPRSASPVIRSPVGDLALFVASPARVALAAQGRTNEVRQAAARATARP